jgi:hypothetical protein
MARRRRRANKNCGMPRKVCNGSISPPQGKRSSLVDWRRVVRKDPARVDLCWVTRSFLNGDVWLIVSPNFGKNKYCVFLHFISYICVCLDLAWVVLACVQQSSITQLLEDLISKGSKLEKESIFQFSEFTAHAYRTSPV